MFKPKHGYHSQYSLIRGFIFCHHCKPVVVSKSRIVFQNAEHLISVSHIQIWDNRKSMKISVQYTSYNAYHSQLPNHVNKYMQLMKLIIQSRMEFDFQNFVQEYNLYVLCHVFEEWTMINGYI